MYGSGTNEQIVVNQYPDNWSAEHGTCVVSVIVGLGRTPYSRGIAPGAKIVYVYSSSNWYDSYCLNGWNAGARIFSASWGGGTSGYYGTDTNSIDSRCWNNPYYVLNFAAGQGSGLNPADDYKLDTITTYATAKNVITVGGVQDQENDDPSDDLQHYDAARGPTDDGRWKPDIMGDFINIYTADQLGTGGDSVTEGETPLDYETFSGTSAATPMVSGLCALIMQDYYAQFGVYPSSSLVKALLINTGRDTNFTNPAGTIWHGFGPCDANGNGIVGEDLKGADGVIDEVGVIVQGWGVANVKDIIKKWSNFYIDDRNVALSTGSYKDYQVLATGLQPLKVTLVWTDYPPGAVGSNKALYYDLDLRVTAPDGTTYYLGNNFGTNSSFTLSGPWTLGGTGPDRQNNVECVFIENPVPQGVYTIRVYAHSSAAALRYALVVSGVGNATGRVEWLGANYYNYYNGAQGTVCVIDSDLNANPAEIETTRVKIYSKADPKGIEVTCVEAGVNSALFTAVVNFTTTSESDASTNRILTYAENDLVTARYTDASPAATVYANVSYDCVAPKISNVFITGLAPAHATLQWYTDELAEGQVYIQDTGTGIWGERDYYARTPYVEYWNYYHGWYILSSRSKGFETPVIKPNTTYKFQVNVTDKAGNWAVDNNNGNYYWFRTPAQPFKVMFVNDEYISSGLYKGYDLGWLLSHYLNLTGIAHEEWNESASVIPTATMVQYDIIIWNCGGKTSSTTAHFRAGEAPLSTTEQTNIKSYLDTAAVGLTNRKPRMCLMGLDTAYDSATTATFRDYFRITAAASESGNRGFGTTNDWLGNNIPVYGAVYPLLELSWADDISPKAGGYSSINWTAGKSWAVWSGTYASGARQTLFMPCYWQYVNYDDNKGYGGKYNRRWYSFLLGWNERVYKGTTTYSQFTSKPISPSGTFAPPPTSISGKVINQTGKEIQGAIVQAVDTADTKIVRGAGWTNESGRYVIVNLNGGVTYRLIANADDSSATYGDVTAVSETDVADINFVISIKNDTGVAKIDNFVDGATYPPGTYDINATVKNYGSLAQNPFDVVCIIKEVPRIYKEDFEDGVADGFTFVSGTWSVSEGVLKQTSTSESFAVVGDSTWTDYTLEAKVKIVSTVASASPPRGGVVLRYQDVNNHYKFRIAPEYMNNTLISRVISASAKTTISIPFIPMRNEWYTLKVVARGPSLKCWIDGTWVFERTYEDERADLPTPPHILSGKVGLWCIGGEVHFDDVYVWNVTTLKSEPLWKSANIGTEENEIYRITENTYATLAPGATKTLSWPFTFTKEGFYRIIVITKKETQNWLNDKQDIVIRISGAPLPPSVLVKAPNGEEVMIGGDKFNISWVATQGTNPLATNPVSIYYSTKGVAGTWTLIAANQPASGIYQWTIPLEQSTDCYIKVEAKDNVGKIGLDVSNSSFTIKVPGFVFTLEPGWNYLTLPYTNATITTAAQLGTAIGANCTHVANWTGSAFVTYDKKTGANNFILEPGRGYLVHIVNGTTKFILLGSKITTVSTALTKGWNNIGLLSSSFAKASDLAANIGNCEAVAYWDNELGRFVIHCVNTGINDFALESGKGYLVFVTISKVWIQTA
ncbi:MAG: S8 family serine peptidase [Candidatus Thermoplasmatota archaeon]|nr:S8 family serine peptidase [Candidatus Thermoplasmatota archaeon]